MTSLLTLASMVGAVALAVAFLITSGAQNNPNALAYSVQKAVVCPTGTRQMLVCPQTNENTTQNWENSWWRMFFGKKSLNCSWQCSPQPTVVPVTGVPLTGYPVPTPILTVCPRIVCPLNCPMVSGDSVGGCGFCQCGTALETQ